MKKNFLLTLLAAALLSFGVFSGCSSAPKAAPSDDMVETSGEKPVDLASMDAKDSLNLGASSSGRAH